MINENSNVGVRKSKRLLGKRPADMVFGSSEPVTVY